MSDPRSAPMAELYKAGKTAKEIGALFGLNRERVRQLISQDHGLTAADGGKKKQLSLREEQRLAKREAVCLATYGCTIEQYALVSGDKAKRFHSQRTLAGIRGIGWELNLWQWWTIWQESGKWALRGPGQGFAMCRKGDIGPYSIGNVFIGPGTINTSEAHRENRDIPVGVRKNARYAGYSASRTINGTRHCLGSFRTPELARAAYEALAPINAGPAKPSKLRKIRTPRPQLPANLNLSKRFYRVEHEGQPAPANPVRSRRVK